LIQLFSSRKDVEGQAPLIFAARLHQSSRARRLRILICWSGCADNYNSCRRFSSSS